MSHGIPCKTSMFDSIYDRKGNFIFKLAVSKSSSRSSVWLGDIEASSTGVTLVSSQVDRITFGNLKQLLNYYK